jgi:hypothetical protein
MIPIYPVYVYDPDLEELVITKDCENFIRWTKKQYAILRSEEGVELLKLIGGIYFFINFKL